MLIIFAVLLGGIITGRLLSSWRLAFVAHLITLIIWALLFLLGLEVGADDAVVQGFAVLGGAAFIIFFFSVAGSIGASWLLWRQIRGHGVVAVDDNDDASTDPSASVWRALRGSLVIIAFFGIGSLLGLCHVLPFDVAGSRSSTYVLYALMFCVGITLGHDRSLAGRVRQLDPRLALLPVMTALGTLLGAAAAVPFLGAWTLPDSLAVGAGFGYYSLSSISIADLRGAELATIALLCNVMREIFTLLAAPLVARWFGPLAAVSIGGATSFDTTLPIITQAAGRPYAVVAIFHGCALDFTVPFLVTLFCTI
ncbi:MAG: lysine exporter LysO family protein [Alistipes sp.]